jgi:cytochrome bd ubiquinol oxidase subunit II
MITAEPSNLALFWAVVIAVAILVYAILDGFDLGVGILFGTTRHAQQRSEMIAAISPFWDGNETWLVVIGASLFAAFPVVYAVFLPAFYLPVVLMLLGLIFRGVAFEFRARSTRGLWDAGFFLGSAVAAFVQGAAVGAMIHGIPVVNHQYAGGPFEWLRPLPVLCGIGLVLCYARTSIASPKKARCSLTDTASKLIRPAKLYSRSGGLHRRTVSDPYRSDQGRHATR